VKTPYEIELRDKVAIAALQPLIGSLWSSSKKTIAEEAYQYADAMLQARGKDEMTAKLSVDSD